MNHSGWAGPRDRKASRIFNSRVLGSRCSVQRPTQSVQEKMAGPATSRLVFSVDETTSKGES